jgi:hypothetical protein
MLLQVETVCTSECRESAGHQYLLTFSAVVITITSFVGLTRKQLQYVNVGTLSVTAANGQFSNSPLPLISSLLGNRSAATDIHGPIAVDLTLSVTMVSF